MQLAVILPAAGQATRFGRNKLLEDLAGETVLHRAVSAFLRRDDVIEIIVAGQETLPLPRDSRVRTTAGGPTRAQSVRNALQRVDSGIEWVAVHDAARPLVSQSLIDRVFAAARQHGAAAPATAVNLTIKEATTPLPAPVIRTVPRERLWAMQTPQIARRADLLEAFDRCPIPLAQVTDDLQLLELIGKPVVLVAGEERNLKITTPLDLKLAELLLRNSSEA